jgi:ABC-2 type transport system permease protein
LSIARKTLRELVRERLSLGLVFVFPILILGFYYVAFGDTDPGLAKYMRLLAVNEDVGATTDDGQQRQEGARLLNLLRALEFEGQAMFDVTEVRDPQAAEIALREHKAALLLTIPPDFTSSLLAPDGAAPSTIALTGDPNNANYIFAHSLLNGLLREFSNYALGWDDSALSINYEFLPGTGTMSDFEFGVPGMMIFGIMFIVMTSAEVLVREKVGGTLRRLQLTRLRARDLLLGITLAHMLVALAQVPVIFGAARLMGFEGRGSLLLAMGIALLLSLSAVGLGLVVACFARNDGEASNLGSGLLVIIVLMSGAMFPMPKTSIVTIAGRGIQAHEILPSTHASEALRRVLILGDGIGDISYELAALTVLSLLTLAAGVALYQRLQMRAR